MEANLNSLKAEIATLQTELDKAEEVVSTAEAPEKEAKEAVDNAWNEVLAARKIEVRKSLFEKLDVDKSGTIGVEEIRSFNEFNGADDDNETVSVEEAEDFLDFDGDGELNETEASVNYEQFDDELFEQISDRFEGTEVDETKPEYEPEVKELIATADAAREARNTARSNKDEVSRKVTDTEKQLGHDWGLDGEFAYMIGQCYDTTVPEYTYTICTPANIAQY